MAPLKRRPPARSQRRMKGRRRKPDIPRLVYKYLQEAARSYLDTSDLCGKHAPELAHTGTMVNRQRKDGVKKPKSRGVKRRRTSKDRLSSCVHKCTGAEGLKKVKKYIQEAVDFGVEFGYLRPKNASCNLLRVSSDLMDDRIQRAISAERERSPQRTPTRVEDYQAQDARRRRRRRRRRRSRSGSRSRRRRSRRRGSRRSRSANPEETAENEDDYLDEDGDDKKSAHGEDTEKNPESDARQDQPDQEKTEGKAEEGDSTTSVDEDETDEDEEKKRDEATKS